MELEEAKRILGMVAGRESGVTTVTLNRDAARVVLDALAVFEKAHAPTAVASGDQVQQCDAERNTDHEEHEADDRAATGRLGVAGSHAKSMAQAAADGKRAISAGLPHSDVLAVQ